MSLIFIILLSGFQPDTTNRIAAEHKEKTLFTAIATSLIRIYQVVVSPRQGELCNFTPSCSNYANEAIKKHGTFGVIKTFDRLERCNYCAWQYKEYYGVRNTGNKVNKLYDHVK